MSDKKKKHIVDIREGVEGDFSAIAHVHVLSWKETYQGILSQKILNQISIKERQKMWKDLLSNKKSSETVCLVAVDKNKHVMGFVYGGRARESVNSEDIEIYALYLLKSFHNKGIGFTLFKQFRERFPNRKVYLWVLKDNPTRSFYERIGGIVVDQKKNLLYDESIEKILYLFR